MNIRKLLYFRLLNSSNIFSISFNLRLTFLCLISYHITRDISEIRIQKAVNIKYISIITFSIVYIQRYAFSIRIKVYLYSFLNKKLNISLKKRKREKYSIFFCYTENQQLKNIVLINGSCNLVQFIAKIIFLSNINNNTPTYLGLDS